MVLSSANCGDRAPEMVLSSYNCGDRAPDMVFLCFWADRASVIMGLLICFFDRAPDMVVLGGPRLVLRAPDMGSSSLDVT
jgi:hypothetical protein